MSWFVHEVLRVPHTFARKELLTARPLTPQVGEDQISSNTGLMNPALQSTSCQGNITRTLELVADGHLPSPIHFRLLAVIEQSYL